MCDRGFSSLVDEKSFFLCFLSQWKNRVDQSVGTGREGLIESMALGWKWDNCPGHKRGVPFRLKCCTLPSMVQTRDDESF